MTNTLARGGAEAMLVRLATALDRRRVRPVVISLREDPGPLAELLTRQGIEIHTGLLRCKYDFQVIGRLSKLVRQYWPACLMAVGSGGDRMFWSTLAGRWTGCPAVVWSHLFATADAPEFEWINRRLYPWVDRLVALGQRHAEALVTHAEAPAGRITVIRNGIDVDEWDQPETRAGARRQMGLQAGQIAVGTVANLRPIKRLDLFIQAAAQVHAARPECRFFVMGEGPLRGELEQLASRLGLDGATITLMGARQDMPLLMHGLDIVALTSLCECLSVAMLEAMAAGKPFVAPRVGSLDEALIDGATGRFFEPATAEQLAAILIELADSPQRRESLGRAAREKVRAEFRVEQMAKSFEDLVQSLLRPGGHDARPPLCKRAR